MRGMAQLAGPCLSMEGLGAWLMGARTPASDSELQRSVFLSQFWYYLAEKALCKSEDADGGFRKFVGFDFDVRRDQI